MFTVTFGHDSTDSVWTNVRSLSWSDLCAVLTNHREGGKRGPCIVPARFRGQNRKQAEADEIGIVMLDADCGHTLEEIATAIRAKGWAAVIHSTHSHMTTRTTVNRARWEAFQAECPIAAEDYFLRDKGYLPHVTAGATVIETTDKEVTFQHSPCPKFRVAMPLSRPWQAADFSDQKTANAAWKNRIEALAAALGLHHDQSCTDTSRLFFLPRHAPGAPFETLVIEGADCDLWSLASAPMPMEAAPPKLATTPAAPVQTADPATGEMLDLTRWAATHGDRFLIATALAARSPGVLIGHVADGVKHHIRCVNEESHTVPGPDGATFVIDAGQSENGGFVHHCRHAHCDGKDRLFFLGRMIERGWLSPADLTEPAFLLGTDEGEPGDVPTYEDCMAIAEALGPDTTPAEINKALGDIYEARLDPIALRMVLGLMKKQTGLPLTVFQQGLAAIRAERRGPSEDLGLKVAKVTLAEFFAGGDHLVRGVDKCFWAYTGTHWTRLTDEQVLNRIVDVVERHIDPDDIGFRTVADAAFKLLTGLRALPGDVLRLTDEPAPVINCKNGELWLAEDGAVGLRPHRFDTYLTYVLDVAYDPTATCPQFDQALIDIFARASDPADMARHFMEFFGYAIQPRRDIACYFMLRGQGNNGKTKLMQTIERLVNKRAIYSDRMANIESDKFAIGSLAGKLILLDDDVDTDTLLPDGFLKKVSERKILTGQLKFKDAFEFVATCLPVMLANNYPRCSDLSWGQRRRAKIIPFDRIFTDADKDDRLFPAIWTDELPGVLNRAIEGLQRLRQRSGFAEPADCRKAMNDWLAHANPLAGFIEETCRADLSASVPTSAFYTRFREWAEEAGIRNIPARNTIKRNLENLGYRVAHASAGSVVHGIEIVGHWYASRTAA
jgi:P4 family phage/plasmid primase-like protien